MHESMYLLMYILSPYLCVHVRIQNMYGISAVTGVEFQAHILYSLIRLLSFFL